MLAPLEQTCEHICTFAILRDGSAMMYCVGSKLRLGVHARQHKQIPKPRTPMSTTDYFEKVKRHFSKTLKELCAEHGSVNQICNGLKINRQQFAKYLSGANLPSIFVVQRLSDYFKVSPSIFFLEKTESKFASYYRLEAPSLSELPSGYYLEYTQYDVQPAVACISAWRIFREGDHVRCNGEVPNLAKKKAKNWYDSYRGTVTKGGTHLLMQASFEPPHEATSKPAFWMLSRFSQSISDFLAIKVQTHPHAYDAAISCTSFFRFIGSELDITNLLKQETGVFEVADLPEQAKAVFKLLEEHREVSGDSIKLMH